MSGPRLLGLAVAALWVEAAVAGPLELERARAHLEHGRPDLARALLLEEAELASDPDGAALHRDACLTSGLGARCATELADAEREAADPLSEAVRSGDDAGAAARAAERRKEAPAAHHLQLGLWAGPAPGPAVERARKKAVKAAVATDPADLVALYRARRLLLLAEDPGAAAVTGALEAAGEGPWAPEPPLDRVRRSELARSLAKSAPPELPVLRREQALEVTSRLSAAYALEGDHAHASSVWATFRATGDDPRAATGHGLALAEAGDLDAARAALDAAVLLSVGPAPTDLAAAALDRQGQHASEALHARARQRRADLRLLDALVDLAVATALRADAVDSALHEYLTTATRPELTAIEQRWARRGTVPADRAAAAAEAALAAGDLEAAAAAVHDALALTARSVPGTAGGARRAALYAPPLAALLALRARIGATDHGTASADLGLALLLPGARPAAWYAERGAQLQVDGAQDAAFTAYARARALGAEGLDEALEATFRGPGAWQAAADTIRPPPEPEVAAASGGATVHRGTLRTLSSPRGTGRAAEPARPAVGRPFPSFELETDAGVLTNGALRGRVVAFSFWTADCDECLQILPTLGRLAHALRREGRDIVVVAVSIDPERADFERIQRIAGRWGVLAHEPDLAQNLGISYVPITWIIDSRGGTRYELVGWNSATDLDRALRAALQM